MCVMMWKLQCICPIFAQLFDKLKRRKDKILVFLIMRILKKAASDNCLKYFHFRSTCVHVYMCLIFRFHKEFEKHFSLKVCFQSLKEVYPNL